LHIQQINLIVQFKDFIKGSFESNIQGLEISIRNGNSFMCSIYADYVL